MTRFGKVFRFMQQETVLAVETSVTFSVRNIIEKGDFLVKRGKLDEKLNE